MTIGFQKVNPFTWQDYCSQIKRRCDIADQETIQQAVDRLETYQPRVMPDLDVIDCVRAITYRRAVLQKCPRELQEKVVSILCKMIAHVHAHDKIHNCSILCLSDEVRLIRYS